MKEHVLEIIATTIGLISLVAAILYNLISFNLI